MLNVVITGGSGFMAGHLIKHLQQHSSHMIGEIRTIDRKQFHRFLEFPENIPLLHYRFELTDVSRLIKALEGADVVFHLARKRFEFKFVVDQHSVDKLYFKDNLSATKCLMEAMIAASVPNLIYVGDAYANLPPRDNFGVSEAMHGGAPSSYLLGTYGEARTKAELHARSLNGHVLSNGGVLRCTFLRPTFVYGEGDYHLIDALHALTIHSGDGAQCVPHYEGPSNGLHQYVYAGTVAKVAETSMRCLLEDARQFAGEYFYCMDETHCTKFAQFFQPIIHALGYHITTEKDRNNNYKLDANSYENNIVAGIGGYFDGYYFVYSKLIMREILARQLWRVGWSDSSATGLSSYALRFFYGLAFGFSDRKQRLLLARDAGYDGASADICAAENKAQIARYMTKTAKWAAAIFTTPEARKGISNTLPAHRVIKSAALERISRMG